MAEMIFIGLSVLLSMVVLIAIIVFCRGIVSNDHLSHSETQWSFFILMLCGTILWSLITVGIKHDIYRDPVYTDTAIETEAVAEEVSLELQ